MLQYRTKKNGVGIIYIMMSVEYCPSHTIATCDTKYGVSAIVFVRVLDDGSGTSIVFVNHNHNVHQAHAHAHLHAQIPPGNDLCNHNSHPASIVTDSINGRTDTGGTGSTGSGQSWTESNSDNKERFASLTAKVCAFLFLSYFISIVILFLRLFSSGTQ